MSIKISWTPQAIEDLAHIRPYIAEDSPQAATRVVATIVALAGTLASLKSQAIDAAYVFGQRRMVF